MCSLPNTHNALIHDLRVSGCDRLPATTESGYWVQIIFFQCCVGNGFWKTACIFTDHFIICDLITILVHLDIHWQDFASRFSKPLKNGLPKEYSSAVDNNGPVPFFSSFFRQVFTLNLFALEAFFPFIVHDLNVLLEEDPLVVGCDGPVARASYLCAQARVCLVS